MSRISVYAGPTISKSDVLDRIPDAVVYGPVAGGDLMAHRHGVGDRVLIIDGYYRDRPSVRHKEILTLLRGRVTVIGASSMGALRAAELDRYGMLGVGSVYDMYRAGDIEGDDEVALLHGDSTSEYRPTTVALVTLRHLCLVALATTGIAWADLQQILTATKSLPFIYRSWGAIAASVDKHLAPVVEQLRTFATATRRSDIKWQDALKALDMARSTTLAPSADNASPTRLSTSWNLYWSTVEGTYRTDRLWPVTSDLDVLNAGRLFSPHYPYLHYDHICGLLDASARSAYDNVETSLPDYIRARLGIGRGAPPPQALCERFLYESECQACTPDELVTVIAARSWLIGRSLDWRPGIVEKCRSGAEWANWRRIVELADAANERMCHVRGGKTPRLLPDRKLRDLFYDLWGCKGEKQANIELWRRGFPDEGSLVAVARRFAYLEHLRRCKTVPGSSPQPGLTVNKVLDRGGD